MPNTVFTEPMINNYCQQILVWCIISPSTTMNILPSSRPKRQGSVDQAQIANN